MRASCVICQGDSNALFLFIYEQCPHYQPIRCMAEKILMAFSFSVKWKRSRQNKQCAFFFSKEIERLWKDCKKSSEPVCLSVCLCWVTRGMSFCVSSAAILQKETWRRVRAVGDHERVLALRKIKCRIMISKCQDGHEKCGWQWRIW